jgi:hypothetical protein
MITVYMKVTSSRNAPWLVGCGAYGCGETEAEAKKVARRELRTAFGPGTKAEVVKVEEER